MPSRLGVPLIGDRQLSAAILTNSDYLIANPILRPLNVLNVENRSSQRFLPKQLN
ncbi:predicted protein [Arabidopsis lyrata subsp. lyrata]|uniref:Predicted protein n=1 Tax=Arabidopsis lyrata subsp. lyrata TaxID=81972 RepID=D7KLU8_ARALL|nr:predicted protein [Arabidopsis lyrata subsp. lyrata]